MNWLAEANVCPGLFYGTPAQDGFLIRIRIPGGFLNQQQAAAITLLVEQGDRAAIQVTNRANLQIRAVQTAPPLEVFQTLQRVGLAAQNPQVDSQRNLMASPTAGIDCHEILDPRPLVQALDAYIQSHPELAGLSAKFSIGIDGGGTLGIGTRSPRAWEHRYNEIQLSAVAINSRVYLHLALGGEKQLHDTGVLVEPEECLSVVAALTAVYLDYVTQAPQTQKKPRMKHLLQEWGVATYLQQVNHRLSHPLHSSPAFTLPPAQPYTHLGIHPQRQTGLFYLGVSLPLGQLTATQWCQLVQLSATFGSGDLRLTPWQSVLLPDIPQEHIPALLSHLAALGLSASGTQPDAAIVACAGKPGCAAAATQTQPHGLALASYLKKNSTLDSPINIHLTGCTKSCAQPSPAEITLLGTTLQQNGETLESYEVYLGDDHSSLKYKICDATSAMLPSVILKLLHLYQNHRQFPHESFGEFIKKYRFKLEIEFPPDDEEATKI